MNLTTDQVNYLNMGLMALACLLAYALPFELFLFSYAVLGPLHYLTEISWLHDRKYFAEDERSKRARQAKRYWLILITLTMAIVLVGAIAELAGNPLSPKWEITLFYLVFITAVLLTQVKNKRARMLVFSLALLALLLFNGSRPYAIMALFLITIIHVLIFTGAFVLYGAIRGRSVSGIISLAVFAVCVMSFFVYAPNIFGHTVGEYARNSYRPFNALNAELMKLFHLGTGRSAAEIYESSAGLAVMRLIAFAYTYHYLNWFSKTSIIKWHEVPKRRTILIAIIWSLSLTIYAYNYEIGMAALYFLSLLHVMLEFPLNYQTFVGIGREVYALAKERQRPQSSSA
ncbi:MAG: hypothetical protein QOC96_91 [Acidobacteriota bacterium]|jgi:hypothetical protein|nr:hypothetical protein [Acidobacteriota bacterium]